MIYMAVHLPVMQRGLGLADWLAMQASMLGETATHQGYNAYALVELTNNPVWWFLRPVGYADFVLDQGSPVVFIGLTNPLVWMAVLPAVYFLIRRALQERNRKFGLVVVLFCASYLPFVLASRPIWVHSGFPAISYGVMAVAAMCTTLLPGKARYVYLVLAALVAIPLYLLAVGKGFEYDSLRWIVELYRPAVDKGL
jgi:dolichyl-phosphate-mannose--protein O-mannosyl transferase